MRRLALVLAFALTGVRPAAADSIDDFVSRYFADLAMVGTTDVDHGVAKIGFTDSGTRVDAPFDRPSYADAYFEAKNTVIAWSADKQVAWASAELVETAGGMGDTKPAIIAWSHGAAVIVPAKKTWHGLAYLVRMTVPDSEQAEALKDGRKPPAFERRVEAGAEPVVKQLEATMTDPKALAKTVSERKDVVLLGSSHSDRVVGGAAVAAALAKWNLRLVVRDGLQAGLAGKTVAWVAANVNAVHADGKPAAAPTPYQLFAVYENAAGSWKLVLIAFAFHKQLGG